MSTLKVNRIEPRTGDSVEIVGLDTNTDQPCFYISHGMPNQVVANDVMVRVVLTGTYTDPVQAAAARVDPNNVLNAEGRFTCGEGMAGLWRFYAQVNGRYDDAASTHLLKVGSFFYKNGEFIEGGATSIHEGGITANVLSSQTQSVSFIHRVEEGDFIELYAKVSYATSGAQLQITGASTNFSGNRISS